MAEKSPQLVSFPGPFNELLFSSPFLVGYSESEEESDEDSSSDESPQINSNGSSSSGLKDISIEEVSDSPSTSQEEPSASQEPEEEEVNQPNLEGSSIILIDLTEEPDIIPLLREEDIKVELPTEYLSEYFEEELDNIGEINKEESSKENAAFAKIELKSSQKEDILPSMDLIAVSSDSVDCSTNSFTDKTQSQLENQLIPPSGSLWNGFQSFLSSSQIVDLKYPALFSYPARPASSKRVASFHSNTPSPKRIKIKEPNPSSPQQYFLSAFSIVPYPPPRLSANKHNQAIPLAICPPPLIPLNNGHEKDPEAWTKLLEMEYSWNKKMHCCCYEQCCIKNYSCYCWFCFGKHMEIICATVTNSEQRLLLSKFHRICTKCGEQVIFGLNSHEYHCRAVHPCHYCKKYTHLGQFCDSENYKHYMKIMTNTKNFHWDRFEVKFLEEKRMDNIMKAKESYNQEELLPSLKSRYTETVPGVSKSTIDINNYIKKNIGNAKDVSSKNGKK